MNSPPTPISRPPSGIERVVSPQVGASRCDVNSGAEKDAPFWMPSWRQSLSHLGWRWILLLPAVGVIGVLVGGAFWPALWAPLWWIGWKLLIMLLAIPVALMAHLNRTAVQRRLEPFCIHCGYGLSGLPDAHRCPECGRPYTLAIVDEYRRDPHWFIRRWRAQQQTPLSEAPFVAGPVRRRRSRDGT
ncbi:MAG TPA: hypothetical protein VFC78_10500 [Tepidisphaeraceae bacterium]|nr:hypothetical protein [Tepidisphaeraceae bacterium]